MAAQKPVKVLYASTLSCLDTSNGASISAMNTLALLAGAGFTCEAFCISKTLFPDEVDFDGILKEGTLGVEAAESGSPPTMRLRSRGVPVSVVPTRSTIIDRYFPGEVEGIIESYRSMIKSWAPDVLLACRADPLDDIFMALAKDRLVPVVVFVHSLNPMFTNLSTNHTACVVQSEWLKRHCLERLGLHCRVLPNIVDWDRVRADGREGKYVTFVNPSHGKGVYVFARIADELGRRRPDIPLLVVEGRGTRETVRSCGLDLDRSGNVHYMPHTPDPRKFWGESKLCLIPSLAPETGPLAAIEAMINGVPVIGSDRGGTPDTLGASGFVLPLPSGLTPQSRTPPSVDEVGPWLETMIRLWDDRRLFDERSAMARHEAERWSPRRLVPLYQRFFEELLEGDAGLGGDAVC